MKLRFKVSNIIVVVLIFIALGLSVAIGVKYYDRFGKKASKVAAVIPPTPAPKSLQEQLLEVPAKDATEKEKQTHYQFVKDHAELSNFLDVSKCLSKPTVMTVTIGKPIQIKNSDEESHEIALNQTTRFTIPAKSSETYAIPFTKGTGIYGFGCDRSGSTAGLFYAKQ